MQCTREEIERKRQQAQERLLQKRKWSDDVPNNHNTSPYFGPATACISPQKISTSLAAEIERKRNLALARRKSATNLNSTKSSLISTNSHTTATSAAVPVVQNPTLNFAHKNFYGEKVTAKCVLQSDTRFELEMPGYSTPAIDIFKSIPSKSYDPINKKWSFDVKDHNLLSDRLRPYAHELTFEKLPAFVIKALRISDMSVVDLSRVDEEIRTALYPYQEDGVCFAIRKRGRCLLADDMGLGKTIQALTVADYYRDEWPLLIVTTASMKNVWEENIYRFLPSVSVLSVQYMESSKDHIDECKVLIVSYELMNRSADKLLAKKFGVFIVDESHTLKNFQAACTKKAISLAKFARRVILLSGTPALSKPSELFTQIDIIDPGFFGNFKDYSKRYCAGHVSQFGWNATGKSNLKELEIVLSKKFMIRRTKESILKMLPNKVQEVVMLDVKLHQFSEDDRNNLSSIAERYQSDDKRNARERHALLLTFFAETARIKIPSVCTYVLQTLETDNKFLVFAHHQVMLNALSDVLRRKRKKYIRIDGSVPAEERKRLIDTYQNDADCVCALLSTTACNAGITLTAGHLVIFAELHWNPSILSQAESRAHRIGQENQVIVKYLLARGTADDAIWPMLQDKQNTLQSLGLCQDSYSQTAVKAQTIPSDVKLNTTGLNKTITDANTLDIATYFISPTKTSSSADLDLLNDEFDDVLGGLDVENVS